VRNGIKIVEGVHVFPLRGTSIIFINGVKLSVSQRDWDEIIFDYAGFRKTS